MLLGLAGGFRSRPCRSSPHSCEPKRRSWARAASAGTARAGAVGTSATAPTRPGLSWEAADSFVRKSLELDQRFRGNRFRGSPAIELTEAELNSYVNLTLASQIPPTVTNLEARFVAGRIVVQGSVDLDRVREGLGDLSPWNPLRLLAGVTPVMADAVLETEAGVGRVSPKEMSLGALPIPSSVLATIVAQVTKTPKQPNGVDILSPFGSLTGSNGSRSVKGAHGSSSDRSTCLDWDDERQAPPRF